MELPEEFVDEVKSSLLRPLNLVRILIPVLIAVCALILVIGVVLIVVKRNSKKELSTVPVPTRPAF